LAALDFSGQNSGRGTAVTAGRSATKWQQSAGPSSDIFATISNIVPEAIARQTRAKTRELGCFHRGGMASVRYGEKQYRQLKFRLQEQTMKIVSAGTASPPG
jgi:hypothetical protein